MYLLSTYYARYDMQKRYAFFYLIGTLCNGLYAVLACNVLIAVIVAINTIHFRKENRLADQGKKVLEGDPNFRYTN